VYSSRNNKGVKISAFFDWFKTNALSLVLLIVGVLAVVTLFPYLKRYFDNQIVKTEVNNLENSTLQNNAQNAKTDPDIIKKKKVNFGLKYKNVTSSTIDGVVNHAQGVAAAFGTLAENNHVVFNNSLSFFNVSSWFENESAAIKLLKMHTGTFPILEDAYYNISTKSRFLKNDIYNYLSDKQIVDLRSFYSSKGFKNI
jgi:hypothetical protein